MQILAIAIYRGDERRVVRFKPRQLNVLPGWSKKGKSSLLEIAEYCLGRTTPTYPGGELDAVTWFALLADFDGTTAVFARPAPAREAQTNSQAMYQEGLDDLPAGNELSPNTTAEALRKQLARLLGIPEDDAVAGEASLPRATSGQALLFCFQRQDEIANANQLFHRAGEEGMARHIRDALPFFLGAADNEYLANQERLRELRRSAREIERELEQARAEASQVRVRSVALLDEASAAGLLAAPPSLDLAEQEIIRLLRSVEQIESHVLPIGGDAAAREAGLRRRLQELNLDLRRVQERRAALFAVRVERGQFGYEVQEQRGRLLSLGLLPRVEDGKTCPVCQSQLEQEDQTTATLRQGAIELRSRLDAVRGLEPERRRQVALLREQATGLRRQIRAVQESLNNLAAEDLRLASLQASERRAYVRGKISQFLEALAPTEEVQLRLLDDRLDRLNAEIERVAAEVDPAAVATKMSSALSFINEWMSESARRLGLEYERVGLDPTNLTVYADRRNGRLPLNRIGSAFNFVGYHITAHTALHRWFVEEQRPVPRFLLLDQPEQAFFPELVAADDVDPSQQITDDDWNKVRAIYTFLHDLTDELNGRLQIIVVGHARLDELEWFSDVIVEDWKNDTAGLVPREWMNQED